MQQIDPQQKNSLMDAGEPDVIVHFTEAELKNVQIGEIIEPIGDFYPEEIDEKEPETDLVK